MSNRLVRHALLVAADGLAVAISIIAAFWLRFEGFVPSQYVGQLPRVVVIFVLVRLLTFYAFGFYRNIWRYASVPEVLTIVAGVTAGSALLFAVDKSTGWYTVPRSVYLIDLLCLVFLVGFIRFLVRIRRQRLLRTPSAGGKRVLIYGAGEAGTRLMADFLNQPQLNVTVVGFLDDDPTKIGGTIHGVPVLGGRHDIDVLTKRLNIEEIIIAMPSVSKEVLQRIVEDCRKTTARLMILPPLSDILNGGVRAQDIRHVEIEDLLGREPVRTDLSAISDYLTGRRVLVTGAGGSIGAELCRQIIDFEPAELIVLGHGENSLFEIVLQLTDRKPDTTIRTIIADIRNGDKIRRTFEQFRPQVVFHAAAHKHVPFMELHPDEAVMNNIFGTLNLVQAADAHKAECFVMVSTDKAVNPGNVMGATKRVAEMIVQAYSSRSDTRFVAVRFGNVLGSRGSVIPVFKHQIARGGPVTVTHPEMRRYFMTIPEAVQLIIQAGAIGNGGELFVLDMGEPIKIVDLARNLIRLSGLQPGRDIEIVFTGARPGEKLFEELVNHGESVVRTRHEKIMQLTGESPDYSRLMADLALLEDKLRSYDLAGLKAELYRIVGTSPVDAVAEAAAASGTAAGPDQAAGSMAGGAAVSGAGSSGGAAASPGDDQTRDRTVAPHLAARDEAAATGPDGGTPVTG